jgi:hypothetical protein
MNKILFFLIAIIILNSIGIVAAADAVVADKGPSFGEPGGGLDKILTFIIPLVMFGLFLMLIYKAFKEPINKAITWIREQMAPKESNNQYDYNRRYKNTYMIPGDIRYH